MIHCYMDRKQEIQNQIAELQRELAGMENQDVDVAFLPNVPFAMTVIVKARSSSDGDVADSIMKWCHQKKWPYNETDISVMVNGEPSSNWHITKVVSYNITPF